MTALKEIGFEGYLAIYMPFTTKEIFEITSRGYGGSASVHRGQRIVRPNLMKHLEKQLKYIKAIESLVDRGKRCR